jgi:hypothetical protein
LSSWWPFCPSPDSDNNDRKEAAATGSEYPDSTKGRGLYDGKSVKKAAKSSSNESQRVFFPQTGDQQGAELAPSILHEGPSYTVQSTTNRGQSQAIISNIAKPWVSVLLSTIQKREERAAYRSISGV